MKLKTLKDLPITDKSRVSKGRVWVGELKKEAIKWVKELHDNHCDICKEANTYVTGWDKNPVLDDVDSIIAWIKQFFNIKEEELK